MTLLPPRGDRTDAVLVVCLAIVGVVQLAIHPLRTARMLWRLWDHV